MLKKIKLIIFIIIIAVCIDYSHQNLPKAEETKSSNMDTSMPDDTSASLLILLDTSITMGTYDSKMEAVRWTEDIIMLCYEMNINLSIIAFKGNEDDEMFITLIENEKITDENCEEMVDRVNELSYTGYTTNQNAALREAQRLLNYNGSNEKCIIILSDGELDLYYENDDDESEDELLNEINEENLFKSACEDITKNGSCSIYLIDIDKEIGFFKDINIENVFYKIMLQEGMEDDQLDNLIDFEGLTKIIFSELGVPIVGTESGYVIGNKIIYESDKKYYRSIITVINDGNVKLPDMSADTVITSERTEHISYDIKSIGASLYIYIYNPSKGKHEIELPKTITGEYSIRHINNYGEINPIIRLMMQDNETQAELAYIFTDSMKTYNIELAAEYDKTELQVIVPDYENIGQVVCFYSDAKEKEEKYYTLNIASRDELTEMKIYKKEIDGNFFDKNEYIIYASVELNDKPFNSESIAMNINITATPTPTPIIRSINDISMYINEEKELESILNDDFNYVQNIEHDVKIEKLTDGEPTKIEHDGRGILCFDEIGEYICTVELKEVNTIIEINITVRNRTQYIKYIIWGISIIVILWVIYQVIKAPKKKTTRNNN